jgi:hypothetical protein
MVDDRVYIDDLSGNSNFLGFLRFTNQVWRRGLLNLFAGLLSFPGSLILFLITGWRLTA